MKKVRSRNLVTTLSLTAIMLAMMTVPAIAYDIDGNLDDWGINLSEDWSIEGTWVPTMWSVDWIVEDNEDPRHGGSYSGVHIEGHGQSYGTYVEPLVNGAISPNGGEPSDIEAMYFDSDYTNAYFAIVASLPSFSMGDLAIDLDRDGTYEYGIPTRDHNGLKAGYVYKAIVWAPEPDNCDAAPYRMWTAEGPGIPGEIAYVDTGIYDQGSRNYVIEISAPRSALGNPSEGNISQIHTTMACGNDEIGIGKAIWTEIPEFSTVAIPVGITFCLFYFYRRKRQGRED